MTRPSMSVPAGRHVPSWGGVRSEVGWEVGATRGMGGDGRTRPCNVDTKVALVPLSVAFALSLRLAALLEETVAVIGVPAVTAAFVARLFVRAYALAKAGAPGRDAAVGVARVARRLIPAQPVHLWGGAARHVGLGRGGGWRAGWLGRGGKG